ncbi:MAG: radical SAM protein [Elusimicrobiota bacterium]
MKNRKKEFQLAVYPWGNCDMSCSYCHFKGDKGILSLKDFISVLLFLKKKLPGFSKVTFLGGEPTLKEDLLIKYLQAAKKIIPYCDFFLFTNGLNSSQKIFKILNMYSVNVILSLDGFQRINIVQRKPSAKIKYSPQKIAEKFLNSGLKSLAFSLTVTPENVRFLFSNISKLFYMGAGALGWNIDYSSVWSEKSLSELKKQAEKERKFYTGLLKKKTAYRIINCYELIEEIEKGVKPSCSTVSLFPDGNLYACDKFFNGENNAKRVSLLSRSSFWSDRKAFFTAAAKKGFPDSGLICRAGIYFYHKFVKCHIGEDLKNKTAASLKAAETAEKEKMKSLKQFLKYDYFREIHSL